ncbi:histidine kinase [Stenotrophomonas sp. SY1]|uniref:sensor histidine kinase n=1 Tax=Stenotrophomonas sp. SY1 TaxID=477235 RepID=UPI001E5A446E|nr:histidine kinase [Stenotrophomonas sp. SY1]MCD9086512.1 histidine kinase [Stenotrophomonas sp. SY1]
MNSPLRQPLDALFRPTTLITMILAGEALAAILALSPIHIRDRLMLFGLASLATQWVLLSTLGLLYLLRRWLNTLSAQHLAWLALAMLLMMTQLVITIGWELVGAPQQSDADGRALLLRSLALAFVAGLLTLLSYQNHWRARQLAVRAKQAELEALQARIRPHFLFNTLNTGAALVHLRPQDAERLLLDLADLFRAALAGPQDIPLAEEIALSRRYAEIEQLRFGQRMRLTWELPSPLPQIRIPTLSIQPLVENAIHHGIEPSPDGGDIRISVKQEENQVSIVIDNALPPAGSMPLRSGHKVGLESTKARIQAMTGGEGDVTTRSENGRHIARITLPITSTP